MTTSHVVDQYPVVRRSQAGLDLLGVRLASDPVGEVARLYGVYKAEENVAFRASFLIDPEGYVVAVEKCDFPVGKNLNFEI